MRNLDNINKKVLDSYTKAGLFYDFGISKNTILSNIDSILEFISDYKEYCKGSDLLTYLKMSLATYIDKVLLTPSFVKDDLFYEIEAIGIYITDHPMNHYTISDKNSYSIQQMQTVDPYMYNFKQKFIVPGVITGIEIRKTKAKTNMASFLLTDAKDSIKMMVFPKAYAIYMQKLAEGKVCIFNCSIKEEDGVNFLVAQDVWYTWEKPTVLGKIIKSESEIEFDKTKDVNHVQIGGITLNFKR
jgi:DNA polymerase III alpha subunit